MNTSLHQRSGEQALRESPNPDVPPPEYYKAPNPATPQPAPQPLDCHFCPSVIPVGETFHRMTVGMNEDGAPTEFDHVRTVEEVSELVICAVCHPRIDTLMDGFLERLWETRIADLSLAVPDAAPEPETTRSLADTQPFPLPEAFSTPYGLVPQEHVNIGVEMLAVAAKAYPQSPEGFALGIIVGRMLSLGLTVEDIDQLVRVSANANETVAVSKKEPS